MIVDSKPLKIECTRLIKLQPFWNILTLFYSRTRMSNTQRGLEVASVWFNPANKPGHFICNTLLHHRTVIPFSVIFHPAVFSKITKNIGKFKK